MQTNEYSEETDDYRGIKAAGILMRAAFVGSIINVGVSNEK